MKVVGRVKLSEGQSRAISPGCTIDLPLVQFREFVPGEAHIGDLLWVQEPFGHFKQKRGRKAEAYQPGPVGCRWTTPSPHNWPGFSECKYQRCEAKDLPKKWSRATLEVIKYSDSIVRCMVHAVHIDAFVKTRAA